MDTTFDHSSLISEQKTAYHYAGFWMRFWAYFLDQIIVFSINGILVYPVLNLFDLMDKKIFFFTVTSILTALISYVYFVVMTKWFSKTLGKQILGLKVISQHEEPLSWGDVIFREVIGRFILQAFFICNLLYVVVAFSPKKVGIHDYIADTYVVFEEE